MSPSVPETLTLILSEGPPVRIVLDEWPIISQACSRESFIRVRQHADGRTIAYGGRHNRPLMNEHGFIVPPKGDIVRAIRRVAGLLNDRALGRECIRSLPPVQL